MLDDIYWANNTPNECKRLFSASESIKYAKFFDNEFVKHVVSNLLCSYNAGWFTFRDMGTFSSFCCFSEDPIGFVMQYNLQAIQQWEKNTKNK